MEKEELQSVYNTLSHYWNEYYNASSKAQSKIEESVRAYANTFPGDLYFKLNQGAGAGLFGSSFFRSDLERSLRILEKEINK